jgi:CDP-diacylglycerol--serine O-phosphatidyltransferase
MAITIKSLRIAQRRKKYKKTLSVIPHVFTFVNAFFGFLAIIFCIESQVMAAAYCIVCATVMDGIDGRLARAFKTVSVFGKELDSLCDAVSFCVAPAVLVYCFSPQVVPIFTVVIVGLYLAAGLFRLARFNTVATSTSSFFRGLPVTVAAFCIALLVLCHESIAQSAFHFFISSHGLLSCVFVLSCCMISTVHFFSIKKYSFRAAHIPLIAFLGVLILTFGWPLLLVMTMSYVVASLLYSLSLIAKRLLA